MKKNSLFLLTFSLLFPTSLICLSLVCYMTIQRLFAMKFSMNVTILFLSVIAVYFYGMIISDGGKIGSTFNVLVLLVTYVLLNCLTPRAADFFRPHYQSTFHRLYFYFYSINILFIAFEDAYLTGNLPWGGAFISDRSLIDATPQSLLNSSQAAATYCGLALIHCLIWFQGDIFKVRAWERVIITVISIYSIGFLARYPNHTVFAALLAILCINSTFYFVQRINFKFVLGLIRMFVFLIFICFTYDFSRAIELLFMKLFVEVGGERAIYYWEAFLNPVQIWIYELSIIEKLFGIGTTASLTSLEHADFGLFVILIESGVAIFILLFAALLHTLARAYLILFFNVSHGSNFKSIQLHFSIVIFIVIGYFHYTPFFTAPGILLLVVNYVQLRRHLQR